MQSLSLTALKETSTIVQWGIQYIQVVLCRMKAPTQHANVYINGRSKNVDGILIHFPYMWRTQSHGGCGAQKFYKKEQYEPMHNSWSSSIVLVA